MSCVVLGVTGASLKSAEIASQLKKHGHDVYVIMTKHATEFIASLTFETLTTHPGRGYVYTGNTLGSRAYCLGKACGCFFWSRLLVYFLGKYANGIAADADHYGSATKAPVVWHRAMNTNMWSNAIVQKNVEALKSRRSDGRPG